MKYIIIITLLLLSNSISGQSKVGGINEDDLNYDYFSKEYKYLDKDFSINISKNDFNILVKKFNFYPSKIKTKKDSLKVILAHNFNSDTGKVHVGGFRLGYTWLRLSYHLWKTPNEVETLSKSFNIKYPYQFKEYILKGQNDKQIDDILKELRHKIKASNIKTKKNIDSLPVNQLLNFALRHSESRIADFNK